MRRLDINFYRGPAAPVWARWALLLIGLGWFTDVTWSYAQARTALNVAEARLALERSGPKEARAGGASRSTEQMEREVQIADATIRRIAMPWQSLFIAISETRIDQVSILAIEPDPSSGQVRLLGEAKDFAALLTFLSRLENKRELTKVRLQRHELRTSDPQRAVSFVVSMLWAER